LIDLRARKDLLFQQPLDYIKQDPPVKGKTEGKMANLRNECRLVDPALFLLE
jgi:hypothetical protein